MVCPWLLLHYVQVNNDWPLLQARVHNLSKPARIRGDPATLLKELTQVQTEQPRRVTNF